MRYSRHGRRVPPWTRARVAVRELPEAGLPPEAIAARPSGSGPPATSGGGDAALVHRRHANSGAGDWAVENSPAAADTARPAHHQGGLSGHAGWIPSSTNTVTDLAWRSLGSPHWGVRHRPRLARPAAQRNRRPRRRLVRCGAARPAQQDLRVLGSIAAGQQHQQLDRAAQRQVGEVRSEPPSRRSRPHPTAPRQLRTASSGPHPRLRTRRAPSPSGFP